MGVKMQLVSVELAGFRSYRDPLMIPIDGNTTALIGRNDAGKSSILEALDIFFGNSKLELSDFTVSSSEDVKIACTFRDLPPAVVLDVNNSTSLSDEYLLDEDGQFTLVKTWTRSKLTAPSLSVLAKHPRFTDGTDPLNCKLATLKKIASDANISEQAIGDRRTSSAYRAAIWKNALSSGAASLEQGPVPLSEGDGKSVATAISSYLPSFHLFKSDRAGTEADKVAQDPAHAVIKAVLSEHEKELEELSNKVRYEVEAMLGEVVERLHDVAPRLADSLAIQDPSPSWNKAFSGFQFVDGNNVPLAKRGSGTRRLVLLSFFRAAAERGIDDADAASGASYHRGVITAVEEPETALHADLQTDIVSALQDVGDLPNRQILLTTHSANLIRLVSATSIRYLTGGDMEARECVMVTEDGSSARLISELNKSLGIFTDHNVRCFILVEGRNDIVALKTLSENCEDNGDNVIASLGRLEAEGRICFMPIGGGGSASLWESNLSPFRRHEVHIMDSDRKDGSSALKPEMTALLDRADLRRHVYVLDRREMENYLTDSAVFSAYSDVPGFEQWFSRRCSGSEWDYLDLPEICAEGMHTLASDSKAPWVDLDKSLKDRKSGKAKKRLNSAFSHSTVISVSDWAGSDLREALQKITRIASDQSTREPDETSAPDEMAMLG